MNGTLQTFRTSHSANTVNPPELPTSCYHMLALQRSYHIDGDETKGQQLTVGPVAHWSSGRPLWGWGRLRLDISDASLQMCWPPEGPGSGITRSRHHHPHLR